MSTIENVPWRYVAPDGRLTFYNGVNQPVAVVLHRMQGYISTARAWAAAGHYGASWHYTVGLDGTILQHLSHTHGGYHAGIPATALAPTWPLWRGHGQNVNNYTLGVEAEGFANGDWPAAQLESLRWLCQKLSDELGIPYDREHFPAHAEIDVVNRVNDFDTPEHRSIVYDYLFGTEEDGMTKEEIEALVNARIDAALAHQFPLLLKAAFTGGFTGDEAKAAIAEAKAALVGIPSAGGVLPARAYPDDIYEQVAAAMQVGLRATETYLRNAAQTAKEG